MKKLGRKYRDNEDSSSIQNLKEPSSVLPIEKPTVPSLTIHPETASVRNNIAQLITKQPAPESPSALQQSILAAAEKKVTKEKVIAMTQGFLEYILEYNKTHDHSHTIAEGLRHVGAEKMGLQHLVDELRALNALPGWYSHLQEIFRVEKLISDLWHAHLEKVSPEWTTERLLREDSHEFRPSFDKVFLDTNIAYVEIGRFVAKYQVYTEKGYIYHHTYQFMRALNNLDEELMRKVNSYVDPILMKKPFTTVAAGVRNILTKENTSEEVKELFQEWKKHGQNPKTLKNFKDLTDAMYEIYIAQLEVFFRDFPEFQDHSDMFSYVKVGPQRFGVPPIILERLVAYQKKNFQSLSAEEQQEILESYPLLGHILKSDENDFVKIGENLTPSPRVDDDLLEFFQEELPSYVKNHRRVLDEVHAMPVECAVEYLIDLRYFLFQKDFTASVDTDELEKLQEFVETRIRSFS